MSREQIEPYLGFTFYGLRVSTRGSMPLYHQKYANRGERNA